ncbi:MAG: hypothetical protein ABEI99_00770 [Halobaculum sp.]
MARDTEETTRSTVAVAAVAVVVLLAGCSGVGNQSTPRSTTTDSQTPTAAATSTDRPVSAATLPPGVNSTGVENASRLVAAHESAVIREGGRVETTTNATLGAGPILSETERTATPNLTTVRYDARVTGEGVAGASVREVTIYGNETSVRQRVTVDGNVTTATVRNRTDTFDVALVGLATARNPVRGALRRGNFSVTGVERTDEGAVLTLRADEYDGGRLVAPANVSGYTATVRVTTDGLVRSVSERIEPVDGVAFGGYRFDYQYRAADSPPEPPTPANATAGRVASNG